MKGIFPFELREDTVYIGAPIAAVFLSLSEDDSLVSLGTRGGMQTIAMCYRHRLDHGAGTSPALVENVTDKGDCAISRLLLKHGELVAFPKTTRVDIGSEQVPVDAIAGAPFWKEIANKN
jgi:hypothetical protein